MNDSIGEKLLVWYAQNKRTLPWRNERNPYKIWLSEIILQQTRVNQGLAYYQRFLSAFPDVFSLAGAPEQKVFRLWQGLGYYNRAENLMKTARIIVSDYHGRFPEDFDSLKKLPGIGDYTAAAIASFAFNKPCAVVDGNVYRVLSRIFGIKTPVPGVKAKKEFTALAQKLMSGYPPAEFNQALMEFGALHCLPKNPDCPNCIFQSFCVAAGTGQQAGFPVKRKKAARKHRYYYYFVPQFEQNGTRYFYLRKRDVRDIWRNLYDFPAFETSHAYEDVMDSLTEISRNGFLQNVPFSAGAPSPLYQQELTHLHVSAYFIPVFLQQPLPAVALNSLSLVPQNRLSDFPVPRLIARYLQDSNLLK
jgi:A/G-specific adenine glycosylase